MAAQQTSIGRPMKLDTLIPAFLEKAVFESGRPIPISSAPWIEAFEDRVGLRFPKTFRRLVTSYAFPEFEAGALWFYPNQGQSDDDLVRRITADAILANVTQTRRLLHFARPADGSYDPICFDISGQSRRRIVRLDHEAILMSEKIVIVDEIAASFEGQMREWLDR